MRSKKFSATEGLCYKIVATFSRGGETTDQIFPLSVILEEIQYCTFGVMAPSAASKQVCSMAEHVVNSRRAK